MKKKNPRKGGQLMARLVALLLLALAFSVLSCGSENDKCLTVWTGYRMVTVQNLVNGQGKYGDGAQVGIHRCYLYYRGMATFSGEEYFAYEAFSNYGLLCRAFGCEKKPENFLVLSRSPLPPGTEMASVAGIWKDNFQLVGMKTDILIAEKISFRDKERDVCVTIEQ